MAKYQTRGELTVSRAIELLAELEAGDRLMLGGLRPFSVYRETQLAAVFDYRNGGSIGWFDGFGPREPDPDPVPLEGVSDLEVTLGTSIRDWRAFWAMASGLEKQHGNQKHYTGALLALRWDNKGNRIRSFAELGRVLGCGSRAARDQIRRALREVIYRDRESWAVSRW